MRYCYIAFPHPIWVVIASKAIYYSGRQTSSDTSAARVG